MMTGERDPLLGNKGGDGAETSESGHRFGHWLVAGVVVVAVVLMVSVGWVGEEASAVLVRGWFGGQEGPTCAVEAEWYKFDPSKLPDSVADPVTNPHLFEGFETGWLCGDDVPACPVGGPSAAADTPANAPADAKAHLFFIGDSTDKLNFHAACNFLLPEEERCDYQCTVPAVMHFPRNVRQHVAPKEGLNLMNNPPHSCCDFAAGTCCMSQSMVMSSPACVPGSFASGLGAVGDLHTCGVDPAGSASCNSVTGANDLANVYSGDGMLPSSTPERIAAALPSFYRWTTETIGMKPRPIVVIMQSGMWDMQNSPFQPPRGEPTGDPLDAAETPVTFGADNADLAALAKSYGDGLELEYATTKLALESVGAPTDCLAFRTFDMFARQPVAAKSRRDLVDALNAVTLATAAKLGVPVHRTEALSRRVEAETGGYWWDPMHQRSYSSRLQVEGIVEFVARCLPAHCALR